jgi:hypothetical protein
VSRPARDPAAEKQLASVQSERDRVEEKLSAVEARDRELCAFRVGDCEIAVKEQRDDLMDSEDLSKCRVMEDTADVTRCMADALVTKGKHAALAAFYANDVSCKQTVLACTDGLVKDAHDAATLVRAGKRERELQALARGAAAANAMTVAEDEIAYLRATLPPSQSGACPADDAHERCLRAANTFEDQFQVELEKDEFNRDVALGLLEKQAKAHSLCTQPEIACLSKTLESHGLYPEAKKWVTRNFDALERRQQFASRVPAGPRARCLTEVSKGHQGRIVNAYVAYVRENVLFFRMQLDKAFLEMHESQAACLKGRAGRSSTRAAVSSNE